MSKLKQNGSTRLSVVAALKQELGGGHISVSEEAIAGVCSLESLADDRQQAVAAGMEPVSTALEGIFGGEHGQANAIGIESATIAFSAISNPGNYLNALRSGAKLPSGTTVIPNSMSGAVGIESFDKGNLQEHAEATMKYNYAAPRQDELGEAFFPTVVASPDQSYFLAKIERIQVDSGHTHLKTGVDTDFTRSNLVAAFRDSTILQNDATDVVPNATDGSSAFFVPTDDVANSGRVINGVTVQTRPLAFTDNPVDLIGLSSNSALIASGLMDQREQLNSKITLSKLFFRVTKSGTPDVIERFSFDVSRFAKSDFLPATDGHSRDMNLSFTTNRLYIGQATKQHSGTATVIFNGEAAGSRLAMEVNINMQVNLDNGKLTVTKSSRKYKQFNGNTETPIAGEYDAVTIELIGFELDAKRSNSSQRTEGKLVTSDWVSEGYVIPTLAPFRVQSPVMNDANAMDRAADALIQVTHAQLSLDAVTTLVNYAAHLEALFSENEGSLPSGFEVQAFEGIGGQVVTPYYKKISVDASDVVNSISSKDKGQDIAGYFATLLSQAIAEAVSKSSFRAALRLLTGDANAKATAIIGTNEVLAPYARRINDDQFLGAQTVAKVVSTPDSRFDNKIRVMLSLDLAGQYHALNSGNLIWIPELLGSYDASYRGATSKDTVVQPRYRHICNVPVMIEIDVTNMDALTQAYVVQQQSA